MHKYSVLTIKRKMASIMNKKYLYIISIILLSGCSTNYGRYQQANDSTPTRKPNSAELHDAIPRAEQLSKGGNKNYQVRGKYYQVLKSAQGFTQTGTASWYGKKFHGHLTSNGEVYNMYSMSAAHKHLPLPTYLKVTNIDNNKSVIVRVNDRGPFHQNRIIDLSYSAAYKLDMLKTGTANVRITAINYQVDQALANKTIKAMPLPTRNTLKKPSFNNRKTVQKAKLANGKYIQVFATKNQLLANKTAKAITSLYQFNAHTPEVNGIYRVQIGPITSKQHINELLLTLKRNGYPNAFKVTI